MKEGGKYLVQCMHGKHRSIMGLHCPQQQGLLPDVDVPGGSPREHELFHAPVRDAHHRLQLPCTPKRAPFGGEASTCNISTRLFPCGIAATVL